jgi:hypothetical protein
MIGFGLLLCAAWVGFIGAAWWFAPLGAVLAVLNLLFAPVVREQMGHDRIRRYQVIQRMDNKTMLVPFAVGRWLRWSVALTAVLFAGRLVGRAFT